jgi:hypothetical protein
MVKRLLAGGLMIGLIALVIGAMHDIRRFQKIRGM